MAALPPWRKREPRAKIPAAPITGAARPCPTTVSGSDEAGESESGGGGGDGLGFAPSIAWRGRLEGTGSAVCIKCLNPSYASIYELNCVKTEVTVGANDFLHDLNKGKQS
jgi:hypothetical protein